MESYTLKATNCAPLGRINAVGVPIKRADTRETRKVPELYCIIPRARQKHASVAGIPI